MTDEIKDSSGNESDLKEQAEIKRILDNATNKARLIILTNGLREAFNIVDLTDPNQKRRAALLEQLTMEQVLVNDDAEGILGGSSFATLEQAMQLVIQQNQHYLAQSEARDIKFGLRRFFEMAHEKTGRPIDPKIPVDSRTDPLDKQVMTRWREWRQGFS